MSVTATVAGITSNTYAINVTNASSTASLLIKVLSSGAVAQSVTVTADMINALNPSRTIFQYSYVDAANRHKYYSALGASLTDILTRYASVTDLSTVQNVVVTGTDNYQAWWPCYQMDVRHLLFGPLYYYPDGSGTNLMNEGYTAYDDTDKQVVPTIIATLENGDPLQHFTSAGQLDGTKCLRIFTGMQNISDQENNNSVKWIKEIDVTVSAASAGGAGAAVAPMPTAVSAQVFADVPASYWAFDKINRLSGLGDLTGYPDGAFRPDGAITRAEFVSILAKVMKLPASDNTALGFVDVSPGDWYGGSVNGAVYAGIIKGYGSNFNPDQPITREQVATILVSALGEQDEARANMNAGTGFADDTAISPWARGFVAVAMQDGLIKGYPDDNSFRPQSSATRAEACAMIGSFMKAYQ